MAASRAGISERTQRRSVEDSAFEDFLFYRPWIERLKRPLSTPSAASRRISGRRASLFTAHRINRFNRNHQHVLLPTILPLAPVFFVLALIGWCYFIFTCMTSSRCC